MNSPTPQRTSVVSSSPPVLAPPLPFDKVCGDVANRGTKTIIQLTCPTAANHSRPYPRFGYQLYPMEAL